VSEGKEILDFLRANFARLNEEFDRVDTHLDGLTSRIGLVAEIASHTTLSPRAGRERGSKRRAEKQSAFRHFGQRRSPVSSESTDSSGRIEPPGRALTKRRMRPVCGMFRKTMLHRVEVRVVQVSRKVSIIAVRVLPVAPLPNAAFVTAGHGR
jgi:hypothetical protein